MLLTLLDFTSMQKRIILNRKQPSSSSHSTNGWRSRCKWVNILGTKLLYWTSKVKCLLNLNLITTCRLKSLTAKFIYLMDYGVWLVDSYYLIVLYLYQHHIINLSKRCLTSIFKTWQQLNNPCSCKMLVQVGCYSFPMSQILNLLIT